MIYSHLLETEAAISFVKECFEKHLSARLSLTRVSSPIAVLEGTGINDDLNGIERPVSFRVKALGEQKAQVVHSLAKWKRLRLMQLGVGPGAGIITDMRALRPDEDYTNLHSVYVDQWDWEQSIFPGERNLAKLKDTVSKIYDSLRLTQMEVAEKYHYVFASGEAGAASGEVVAAFGDAGAALGEGISASGEVGAARCEGEFPFLPPEITFLHTQQLLDLYPGLSPKEREREAAREYGAIFLIGIGGDLSNGQPHDGRAPDYDDWSSLNEEGYHGLNGDIIVWHPVLECALELSSMGVRVNRDAMMRQLELRGCPEKAGLQFHSLLMQGLLPECIGGGIGQSRVCMFMLRKRHIGEVQVGIWSDHQRSQMAMEGVELL